MFINAHFIGFAILTLDFVLFYKNIYIWKINTRSTINTLFLISCITLLNYVIIILRRHIRIPTHSRYGVLNIILNEREKCVSTKYIIETFFIFYVSLLL